MKHYITIALCTFLSQICTGQVMMLFSQDSLTGIVSPLDVDSLFYWFAADVGVTDSLGGAIATDEGVGTWNDLSGNGHHVTQSTNGARPVWKATGGPGSKPCIQFDGTNDFLASASHFWGSDDLTVFVVMKFGNATRDAAEYYLSKNEGPGDQRQWAFFAIGSSSYLLLAQFFQDGTISKIDQYSDGTKSASWKLLEFSNSPPNLSMWTDGGATSLTNDVTTGDGTIYDLATTKLNIGATNTLSTPGGFLQGSISEIIVYSRALTATERTAIENYLNRKYDLY